MAMALKSLMREPLLHFLVLGAALFVTFDLFGSRGNAAPGKIVVTQGQIAALREDFQRTWQRPPTPDEVEGLVGERVRDEVYYREALALGLDKDDAVIRRRLRQKLEFVSEDSAASLPPKDDELQRYFDAHTETFRGADGRIPAFEDARDAALREWMNAKRLEAEDAYYRELRKKYSVVVER
jgi:hypothetical protein